MQSGYSLRIGFMHLTARLLMTSPRFIAFCEESSAAALNAAMALTVDR